jgi:lipopolysaccharide transport system permease protein
VPQGFGWVIYLNPIYYMTQMYRATMISGTPLTAPVALVYVLMCLATFALGGAFFERVRGALTDYE